VKTFGKSCLSGEEDIYFNRYLFCVADINNLLNCVSGLEGKLREG